jgi:UDP-N-acetylglucosamine 2-epimerase (non-hydrolysing)
VVIPVHPNPDVRRALAGLLDGCPRVQLIEPLGYPEFVALLRACEFVLTDSGGVQEEAPVLGKPVLVLRDRSERPEGIAAGVARLVGTHPDAIVAAIDELWQRGPAAACLPASPYGDGRAAARIVRVLAQHFDCGHPSDANPTPFGSPRDRNRPILDDLPIS